MAEQPTTRPSLLVRLRDAGDAAAWQEFVRLYAPLIYGLARRRGLQDADAADLTQEVLRAVAGAAGRFDYDPRRGSFRGWLFTVAHNKLVNFHAARARRQQGSGDTAVQLLLEDQPAAQPDEAAWWEEGYRRQLLQRAFALARAEFHDSTWQAFWRTAVEGQKPCHVARGLGMSVAAVYKAKSRVLAQLRKQIQEWQET